MPLTKEEIKETKKRIKSFNDERLINEVIEKKNQYLPEAFSILKSELKNRGYSLENIIKERKIEETRKTNEKLKTLKERIKILNDKQLIDEVVKNSERKNKYLPEDFSVLKKELKNRGYNLDKILKERNEWREEKIDKNLPFNWFEFYVYFRIPAGLIFIVISFILTPDIFLMINAILLVILFRGLKNRTLWGWRLNFAVLVLEALFMPMGLATSTISYPWMVVIVGLIWTLPNWIYFLERKHLFS